MTLLTADAWEQFLRQYPDAHILQSAAWGELKSSFGWDAVRLVTDDGAGAQVLFRGLPLGFCLAYVPKGPVGPVSEQFWAALDDLCRQRRAVFLKVEPDLWESARADDGAAVAMPAGFAVSEHSVQPPRTISIDLRGGEDQILARMKQKTRYNIRLAGRKGVVVRSSADIGEFSDLMQETGARDAFSVHSREYYQQAYDLFHANGSCELLTAEVEGEAVAGLMVFTRGSRAWYFYGASASKHRNRMPTYLLQWEAMRWALAQGCSDYDLWGVPDEEESVLEEQFLSRSDGLWGVYRFKRGFGGWLCRAAGPWERVYNPLLYRLYTWRVNR